MRAEPSDVATRTSNPGRTLVIFLLVVIAMFASVAAVGTWKPEVGSGLQGGERIVLQAQGAGGGSIDESKLTEAAAIISSRVNGAGVSESDVSTQGSDIIVVEIPGEPDQDLKRSLDATAQLRFRLVAQQSTRWNRCPRALHLRSATGAPARPAPRADSAPRHGSTAPTRRRARRRAAALRQPERAAVGLPSSDKGAGRGASPELVAG
jgi:preprotein translocase subunit SecD